MCTNCHRFPQTGLPKMRELNISCLKGGLVSPKRTRKTNCAELWRILLSNKSAPTNRKKGFCTCCLLKNEEIRWIFEGSSKELGTLFKNSRSKIKNKKPLAVDVLS
jgi:hypothetical protein